MKLLEGQVALVTGGSRGIGRAISLALAGEGAAIAVNYLNNTPAAEDTVRRINNAGGHAVEFQADVAIREQADRLLEQVMRDFGRLDILINNAGWSKIVPHEQLDLLTDEVVDQTLAVNLKGPLNCVRAAVPHLRKAQPGRIVNIASVAGLAGRGSSLIYAAAKAGLLTLSRGFARVLAPEIRVNCVLPGFVNTGFVYPQDGAMAENVARKNYLGRTVTAEDVAAMVRHLVTAGDAITGEEIVVDGGLCRLWPR
jgi:3-oxoacyl-[acyl-carrier protein] reductase